MPSESGNLRISDLVCSVAFAALLAISIGLSSASQTVAWGIDASGALFLIISFAYRGSIRAWWLFWIPVSVILLFAPMAFWERAGLISANSALRFALLPALGFIAGSMVSLIRDTRKISLDGTDNLELIQARVISNRAIVKNLNIQVQELICELNNKQASLNSLHHDKYPEVNSDLFSEYDIKNAIKNDKKNPSDDGSEVASSESAFEKQANSIYDPVNESHREHRDLKNRIENGANTATAAISHIGIHHIVEYEVDQLKERLKYLGLGAVVRFNSNTDSPVPLAVRSQPEILRLVVRDLLGVAVDSLLRGAGVVTISLRPGLHSVKIEIEDNGRGLNESMLVSLEDKGLATRTPRLSVREIRSLIAVMNWNLTIHGRLGVGSRTTLELPRVDILKINYPSRSALIAKNENSSLEGRN